MPFSPIYVLLKTAAYTTWCAIGLARQRGDLAGGARMWRAIVLGVLRALLGLGFGIGIWLGSSLLAGRLTEIGVRGLAMQALVYLAVYVPVRLIEWSIISALAFRRFARGWVLGGIVLSVLADVPMVVMLGGLPLGRFMC